MFYKLFDFLFICELVSFFLSLFFNTIFVIPQSAWLAIQFPHIRILSSRAFVDQLIFVDRRSLWVCVRGCMNMSAYVYASMCVCVCHSLFVRYAFKRFSFPFFFFCTLIHFYLLVCLASYFSVFFFLFALFSFTFANGHIYDKVFYLHFSFNVYNDWFFNKFFSSIFEFHIERVCKCSLSCHLFLLLLLLLLLAVAVGISVSFLGFCTEGKFYSCTCVYV